MNSINQRLPSTYYVSSTLHILIHLIITAIQRDRHHYYPHAIYVVIKEPSSLIIGQRKHS